MNRWFYLVSGKTKGPASKAEVASMISEGRMGALDLLFKEGESQWRSVCEFPEFETLLGKAREEDEAAEWILLRKKEGGHDQVGPLSESQILEMIQRGQVRYADYVWKEGMKEWYRISSLKQFAPDKNLSIDLPPVEGVVFDIDKEEKITEVDLLDNVMIQESKEMMKEEALPPGAEGPDLVKQVLAEKKRVVAKKPKPSLVKAKTAERISKPVVSKASTEVNVKPAPSVPRQRRAGVERRVQTRRINPKGPKRSDRRQAKGRRREKTWVQVMGGYWGQLQPHHFKLGAFALFCTLIGVSLVFVLRPRQGTQVSPNSETPEVRVVERESRLKKPRAAKSSSKSSAKSSSKSQPRNVVAAKKVPAPPASRAKKVPASLKVNIKKTTKKGLVAVIQSRGSFPGPLQVLIHGKAGQILERPSFYLKLSLPAKGDRELSLTKYGLPQGSYKLEVFGGDQKRTKYFFVGKDGKKYKQALWRHKKKTSYWHQNERWALYQTSKQLEGLAESLVNILPKGSARMKKGDYLQWKKRYRRSLKGELRRMNLTIAKNYYYPEVWLDMQEKWVELGNVAQALSQSSAPRRDSQFIQLTRVKRRLRKLQRTSARRSLWR